MAALGPAVRAASVVLRDVSRQTAAASGPSAETERLHYKVHTIAAPPNHQRRITDGCNWSVAAVRT